MRLGTRRHSPSRLAFAALLTASCSSSTESREPQRTHPVGTIVDTLVSSGNAHGVAISRSGRVIVTELYSGDVRAAPMASFNFGPPVLVGFLPVDVAITQQGRTAFVANLGESTVTVLDVVADSQTAVLTVPTPLRVLLRPDDSRLYVTTEGGLTSAVYVFDAHSNALIDTVVVGGFANGIAYDSALARLYVTTQIDGSIYEIDAEHDVVLRQIHVGGVPQDIAISPDHSELWLADESAGVRVFDLVSGAEQDTVPGTGRAFGLAISPDGARVYSTATTAGVNEIIDRATRTVVSAFATGNYPVRVAFNASGSRAVITDGSVGALLIR